MKIDIKDVNQCVKEITITVPKERAQQDYQSVLKDLKKYATVPGYRKGKAPLSMVANMFGDKVKENYLSEKVTEYYKEAAKEKEIEPLFPAQAIDVKWEPNEELTAVLIYEVKPQVKIEKYTGLEVPVPLEEFEEKLVEDTIKKIQDSHVKIEEASVVDKDCQVTFTGKLWGGDQEDDAIPPELTRVDMSDHGLGDDFEKDVLGCSKGEELKTHVLLDDDQKYDVNLKVEDIVKEEYPPIDDKLAQESGHESLAALKEFLTAYIKETIRQTNREHKEEAVLSKIMEENPFDLPPTSVREYAKDLARPYANHYNQPVEVFARDIVPVAEEEMKKALVFKNIKESLSLEVTEEDKQSMIDKLAKAQNLSEEEYLKRNPDVTNSTEFVDKVEKEKLLDHLLENNTFVPQKEKEQVGIENTEQEKEDN